MKPDSVDINAEPQRKRARRAAKSKSGTKAPNQTATRAEIDSTDRPPRTRENGDPYKLEGLDRVVAIMELLGESNDCLESG